MDNLQPTDLHGIAYDNVLEIIAHYDSFTSQQIDETLTDPETKDIYDLICKTGSAFAANAEIPDVEEEWERFSKIHIRPKFRFLRPGNRAASIAAIALTSLATFAIGIVVTINLSEQTHPKKESQESIGTMPIETSVMPSAVSDTATSTTSPILFEDETFGNILRHIADYYNVEVEYRRAESAELRLYYMFDPALSFDDIIEQLNTFEQINLSVNGSKIIVD